MKTALSINQPFKDWVNTTSKEDIKKAVMDYGAVSISYWSDQSSNWSTQYYNSLTAAYYCPEGHTTIILIIIIIII